MTSGNATGWVDDPEPLVDRDPNDGTINPDEYVPEEDPHFEDIMWKELYWDWRDDPQAMLDFMMDVHWPEWIGEICAE